ncbi:hypothetical protein SAMN05421788_1011367 [Filimonas lacunae]|uniref:Uncharacterized protein n=1 Tax=Filimonas lacunae TaxID=477680 RepID=A0A1N7M5R8_9BACT|nr:hypothetical protein SAMN05421788_1011367 [Filimonas lacunae]
MNSRDFNPKPLKNIVKVVFCIVSKILLMLKNCLKVLHFTQLPHLFHITRAL